MELREVTTAASGGAGNAEALVERARGGDREALGQLVRSIRDRVYQLSLRMLGEPADAEDATQEILVRVVTRLASFRGDSKFTTWVYAVAANHLRTTIVRRRERRWPSLDQWAERHVDDVLDDSKRPDQERTVLTRELRLLCLHGVLLRLDRDHRLAFVLGDWLDLSGTEAAQVLDIQPATFRKRLSRARMRVQELLRGFQCGLLLPAGRCRCDRWCQPAIEAGVLDPNRPSLALHPVETTSEDEDLKGSLEGLDELRRIQAIFRSLPQYRAPDRFVEALGRMLSIRGTATPS